MQHLGGGDGTADRPALQTAADDFDFRQFRHGLKLSNGSDRPPRAEEVAAGDGPWRPGSSGSLRVRLYVRIDVVGPVRELAVPRRARQHALRGQRLGVGLADRAPRLLGGLLLGLLLGAARAV